MTAKKSVQSNKIYTTKHKQKLADKISKLKNKNDLVHIAEIICKENPSITENSNGVLMLFHKFSNETYAAIELHLKIIQERDNLTIDSDSCATPKSDYHQYEQEDFPCQDGISPKLKLSNKEKSVIKKKRYDSSISIENNTNSDVMWQEFNISNLSDSSFNPDVSVIEQADTLQKPKIIKNSKKR
jgi:hypothetical protein